MAKKTARKIASKGADQYMVRFPEGMRDKLAALASSNGRSMNTEIIAALEKHLQRDSEIANLEAQIGELWHQVLAVQDFLDPHGERFNMSVEPPRKS